MMTLKLRYGTPIRAVLSARAWKLLYRLARVIPRTNLEQCRLVTGKDWTLVFSTERPFMVALRDNSGSPALWDIVGDSKGVRLSFIARVDPIRLEFPSKPFLSPGKRGFVSMDGRYASIDRVGERLFASVQLDSVDRLNHIDSLIPLLEGSFYFVPKDTLYQHGGYVVYPLEFHGAPLMVSIGMDAAGVQLFPSVTRFSLLSFRETKIYSVRQYIPIGEIVPDFRPGAVRMDGSTWSDYQSSRDPNTVLVAIYPDISGSTGKVVIRRPKLRAGRYRSHSLFRAARVLVRYNATTESVMSMLPNAELYLAPYNVSTWRFSAPFEVEGDTIRLESDSNELLYQVETDTLFVRYDDHILAPLSGVEPGTVALALSEDWLW